MSTSKEEFDYIYVTSFFHKKLGRRIHARDCGKKAFRLRIRRSK